MVLTSEDYLALRKEVEDKCLLKHTPVYHITAFTINSLLLAMFISILFYFNSWLMTILMSIPIAFVGIQFGYLGHDAGHMSISRHRIINRMIGYFSHSFILGTSLNYWNYVHNQHHAEPNHEESDPDIKEDSPFAMTKKKANQRKGLARIMTRYQSFLLLPAFLGLMFTKRYKSWQYLLKNRKVTTTDIPLLILHHVFFLAFISYFIGIWQALVFYILVSMQIGFYFGFSFIPNHIGMPTLSGSSKLSYLEKQVITSRDINGGRVLTFILGGLNYQIEHHLFPHVSRRHLSKIKVIVKEFCAEKGVPYQDTSLAEAWKDVLSYLNDIGKSTKRFPILKTAMDMV